MRFNFFDSRYFYYKDELKNFEKKNKFIFLKKISRLFDNFLNEQSV